MSHSRLQEWRDDPMVWVLERGLKNLVSLQENNCYYSQIGCDSKNICSISVLLLLLDFSLLDDEIKQRWLPTELTLVEAKRADRSLVAGSSKANKIKL